MTASVTGPDDLQPGDHVGEYVIEAKVGQGSFGAVYRAVQPVIQRTVAIKVLNAKDAHSEDVVSRFIAEARAANSIGHRNIISIFAFGVIGGGRHYLVMEYVPDSLLSHLRARGHLSCRQAEQVLVGLCRALGAAHRKGIVHRDLKPSNVLLDKDEEGRLIPRLLDFGVAKLLGAPDSGRHKTQTGAPMGTPAYMAPEQCRAEPVDHRADIYALGVVACELLTGRRPIDGESSVETMAAHISQPAAAPSTLGGHIGPELDACILQLLAKRPEDRPTSMEAAEEALVRAFRAQDASTSHPKEGLLREKTASLTGGDWPASDAAGKSSKGSVGRRGMWVGALMGLAVLGLVGFVFWDETRQGPTTEAGTIHKRRSLSEASPMPKPAEPAKPEEPVKPEEPAKPEEPTEAARRWIDLRVEGRPLGMIVMDDRGTQLGSVPGVLRLPLEPAQRALTFRAEGHHAERRVISVAEDRVIRIELRRRKPRIHKDLAAPSFRKKP